MQTHFRDPTPEELLEMRLAGAIVPVKMKPPANAIVDPVSMDLSQTAVEEAATRLGAYRTYTLRVCPTQFIEAKRLAWDVGARQIGNPFAPYLNVEIEPGYESYEWSLHGGEECFWSPGA